VAYIWLENVGQELSKEDLHAFLAQCGLPPCDDILYLTAGRAPSILLRFQGVSVGVMHALRSRIHHKHIQGRRISAFVMSLVWD